MNVALPGECAAPRALRLFEMALDFRFRSDQGIYPLIHVLSIVVCRCQNGHFCFFDYFRMGQVHVAVGGN